MKPIEINIRAVYSFRNIGVGRYCHPEVMLLFKYVPTYAQGGIYFYFQYILTYVSQRCLKSVFMVRRKQTIRLTE